jgi:hypothetical protein
MRAMKSTHVPAAPADIAVADGTTGTVMLQTVTQGPFADGVQIGN